MAPSRLPPNAAVLFAPVEIVDYRLWVKVTNKAKVLGVTVVPTAFEHAEFQQWREQWHEQLREEERARISPPDRCLTPDLSGPEVEDELGFTLAEKCKHALHPAQTQVASFIEEGEIKESIKWCSTCTLQHHQTLISNLYTNWKKVGGPWRDGPLVEDVDRFAYQDTNRAYQTARVALVNTIPKFEAMAREEENWNLAHPEQDVGLPMAYSATQALKNYHRTLTFPARLSEVQAPQTPTNKRLKEKKLEYSPDTPQDTRHRPSTLWGRYLSSHDPDSPHACASPEGYQDTSYYHNWHFCVSQCRILFCHYVDKESLLLHYHDLNAGADSGLENPHVKRLIELIERHVSNETREKEMQWRIFLKDTSDIFLVWNYPTMMDVEDGVFTHFEHVKSLVGSSVQDYARLKGEIDDEEWATRKEDDEGEEMEYEEVEEPGAEEGEEEGAGGEEVDFYDQMSAASDSDSDNEIVKMELADLTDMEEDDEQ
ncbi:hypothetical protein HBH48_094790 [Parastagonospora nodorum]|nr:hypothetical protein HBH48_094790 [Parastagonospora nodorum]